MNQLSQKRLVSLYLSVLYSHLFFRIGSLCEAGQRATAHKAVKKISYHIQSTVNDLFLYITLGTDSL